MDDKLKIDVEVIPPKGKKAKSTPVTAVEGKVLEVKSESTAKHTNETIEQYVDFDVPAGHVLVDSLDVHGNTKGKPFTVREKEFYKYFTDDSKFKLIKKKK